MTNLFILGMACMISSALMSRLGFRLLLGLASIGFFIADYFVNG